MTVQVIKRGNNPDAKKYEATCRTCDTEFSFQGSDVNQVQLNEQEGKYYVSVNCPVCDHTVWKEK